MPFSEPELTAPVDLCHPDGQLNRAAIGWSRHPLHRCNVTGHWPRKKKWDFWGVTSDECMFALTYGATDYVGIVSVTWLEYARGKRHEATKVVPLAMGMSFPETVAGFDMRYSAGGFDAVIEETADGTRLKAGCRLSDGSLLVADLLIERPRNHETLNVVIPWSDRAFQFTSKQNTRPAKGSVTVAGKNFRFDHGNHSFGCLDYGRGAWPFRSVWNWGAASGWQDGRLIGLNLGGKWTDGTGMTENGVCVDGRLHKLSEPLAWSYDRNNFRGEWRIRAPETEQVDLSFTPKIYESQRIELLVAGTELHWALGYFNGRILLPGGGMVVVRDLLGWAEEHTARW